MGNQSSQLPGQPDGNKRSACVTTGMTLRDKGFAALERDFQVLCDEPNHAGARPSQQQPQLEDARNCRLWPAHDDMNDLNDALLHT